MSDDGGGVPLALGPPMLMACRMANGVWEDLTSTMYRPADAALPTDLPLGVVGVSDASGDPINAGFVTASMLFECTRGGLEPATPVMCLRCFPALAGEPLVDGDGVDSVWVMEPSSSSEKPLRLGMVTVASAPRLAA